MKKNLMSVIILALVVVNLVLTAILMFTIMPQTQKANELITKVCEAIDLDLNSGAASSLDNLPMSQKVVHNVAEGATMTVNLADGKHYVVVAVAITVNNESDEYKANSTTPLLEKEALIKDAVRETISKYTKEELSMDSDLAKNEISKILKKDFGANYVVGVSFPTFTFD